MQIVDAQIHLWGTGLPSNLSHRQVTAFTPAEAIALMDEGGVDAAVIHPPGWDPNSTEMAFQAVQNYPGRFAVMGAVPLDRPESRARIASWRQQPGMLGLRYGFLSDPARQWLRDGTLDWLWATAENAGVPHYSSEAYPFPALHSFLRHVYDAFGPNRMFWGTDITKMPCSWHECVTMFTEELPWLSEEDKRLIMGEALCAWWGWNRTKEIPQ